MALEKRTLGRTGLEVTALGYGAMEVRGSRIWGGRPVTEEQADTILNAVLDAGINFIDTANDYGRSEEFIGKYHQQAAQRVLPRHANAAVRSFTRTRTRTRRPTSGRAKTCFAACTRAWNG